MADPTIAEKFYQSTRIAVSDAVRRHGINLPPPQEWEAFGEIFARFGDARIVLLGEATHGSAEFYQARAAITRHLIEHHGFTIVAVEADWPDAARIDRYVRHRQPKAARGEAFARSRPGCGATSR
jgi:erythromycin esterase-like protein